MDRSILEEISFKRKETILETAIEIIHEAGVQGLTTKEIARREGITEPAIYRQYSGKKEIILSIIQQFGRYDEAIFSTIREQNMDPKAGILFFMEAYAAYYESSPQLATLLFSLDIYRYEPDANQLMKDIMNSRYTFLAELVKRGQELGSIDDTLDSEKLSDCIMGILLSSSYRRGDGNTGQNLRESVMQQLQWILRQ
jgi:TetR/AcrR family transcriptional regulator, fatty acid metabolism regulator protein